MKHLTAEEKIIGDRIRAVIEVTTTQGAVLAIHALLVVAFDTFTVASGGGICAFQELVKDALGMPSAPRRCKAD